MQQRDFLGSSLQLDTSNENEKQESPPIGGGQFDDAEDCENGDMTNSAPLQSNPPCAVSHSFTTAPPPVLVVDGATQPAVPFQQTTIHSAAPSAHPLQCLVEAACASKSRTPKRVSLSPSESTRPQQLNQPPLAMPALTNGARRVSDGGQDSHDDDNEGEHEGVQPSLSDSKTPRKSFEERYSELVFFKKRFGHCDVLTTGDYKGLGRWVSTLRCRFRDGEVPAQQAVMLRELGCIGFGDEPNSDKGNTISAIDEKENIHPKEMPSYATYGGAPRPVAHGGFYHHHPPPPHYHHQHNHLPPTVAFHPHHPRSRIPFADLGGVSNHPIRSLTGPPPHSFQRMPAPPAVPSHYAVAPPPHEADRASWAYRVNQLGSFRAQYGHTNVSTVSVQTNKRDHQDLALWLASQRNLHRKGQLPRERADVLHSHFDCPGFEPSVAPMDLTPVPSIESRLEETAESRYSNQQQQQAFDASQHPSGPSYHHRVMPKKTNMHLCDVLHAQRIYRDQCKEKSEVLAAEKATLATKPGRKRGQYVGWHERLEQLNEFSKANGHVDCRIMMHDKHKDLGRWLASQRHQFRKGKLPEDKAEILQNMGVSLTLKKPQCYRTGPNAPQYFSSDEQSSSS